MQDVVRPYSYVTKTFKLQCHNDLHITYSEYVTKTYKLRLSFYVSIKTISGGLCVVGLALLLVYSDGDLGFGYKKAYGRVKMTLAIY
jgi:hypothetical protein